MNTDTEVKKVAKTLDGPQVVTIFYSVPSWTLPDGTVRGWKLIIEHENQLQWIFCYSKSLAEKRGMQEVEIYRNSQYERAIKPWKG